MISLIGDMGGEGRYPIQHGKHLNVPPEDRVHLGMIEDGLALWMIAHLLLAENAKNLVSPRACKKQA